MTPDDPTRRTVHERDAPGRPAAQPRRAPVSRLRLEPWGVDHLGSLQDADGMGAAPAEELDPVDLGQVGVEMPPTDWRPVAPRAAPEPDRVLFLDGSRRIEARVLLEDDVPAFGAFGSCAVGAASCSPPARATFVERALIERWCLMSGGRDDVEGLTLGGAANVRYRVAAVPETDADAPVRLLQAKMRAAERELAAELLTGLGDGLLVCDGQRPFLGGDRRLVGYLKSVQAQRLPPAALRVVRSLGPGERSPLYLVGSGSAARFEWYVRLRDPGSWRHTLAGSVRLQAYAGPEPEAELEWARQVADWSAIALPAYATRWHQDPRAPQQLLPVMALEQRLKRRMGSAPLLRRGIVAELAKGTLGPDREEVES